MNRREFLIGSGALAASVGCAQAADKAEKAAQE